MTYTKGQAFWLVLLRIGIGWHFLYEGASKMLDPSWTSKPYLIDSQGFMSCFFEWLAAHDDILLIVDMLNEWGLSLIGLSLILGLFSRLAAVAGALLLFLYYLSHPAWPGLDYVYPQDGNFLIIDKIIVEMLALMVVYVFPTSHIAGLARILPVKN